jgi:tetratricopeptide (TPR) repeat protein
LVEVLERQKRHDDALLELVNAAARPDAGSQFVLRLADAYERAKQHDKTLTTLDEAVRRYPNDPEVYAKLGLVHASSDPAKAEEAYKKAISLDNNHQLSLNNLGALYIAQARYQDAHAIFQQALSRDPNSLSTNFNMGQVELALGRNPDAIQRFEKILTRRPGDPLAWSNLALGYIQDGKSSEALAKLKPLLDAPEPHDVVSYAAGLAHLFDGKLDEAAPLLAASNHKSGGRVFQALAYAELLRQQNKLDDADKVLAKLQKGSASAKSFSLPYLALLRHSQGRPQEAAALRDEAMKAQPDAKTPDDLRHLLRMPPKAIADLKAIPPTQAPAASPDAGPSSTPDAGTSPTPAPAASGCACALPQRGEAPTSPSPAWLLLGLLLLRRRR